MRYGRSRPVSPWQSFHFVQSLPDGLPVGKPADLKGIYIRSDNGNMVQLDNLIELTGGIAPPKLYRYNRFVSATISAGL